MMNLLVTGATGFVGSHLVEEAVQQNFNVFVLIRKTSSTQHLKGLKVTKLYAELTDKEALKDVFESLNQQNILLDAVIHCAGLTKAKSLDAFMFVNDHATGCLVNLLKNYQPNLDAFVFVSSLAANGPGALGTVIQLNDFKPITDYGHSKLAAEVRVKKSGIPYVILRPTAVYGPREKDIFILFKLISRGISPTMGYNKQDLTFIYVKDLVQILLEATHTKYLNKTHFVTDGNIYDKKEIGDEIMKVAKRKVIQFTIPLFIVKVMAFITQFVFGLRKKLAPLNLEKFKELKAASWVCDTDSLQKAFDYTPKYDLESGVSETYDWYKKEGWIN